MPNLNLNNQKNKADNVKKETGKLMDAMEERKSTWMKCNEAQKISWIENDPVMNLAHEVFKQLSVFFKEMK